MLHVCNTFCLLTGRRVAYLSEAAFPSFFFFFFFFFFLGMVVALILVVDPKFFVPIYSQKYTLHFGYLRIFYVTTLFTSVL
jgi:hypothetical protein